MCSAFLAQETEHSAVCLSMQSKTKSPRAEAGSETCTLSSLQADKHRQQCVNERAMHAVIMQYASAPSTSHYHHCERLISLGCFTNECCQAAGIICTVRYSFLAFSSWLKTAPLDLSKVILKSESLPMFLFKGSHLV